MPPTDPHPTTMTGAPHGSTRRDPMVLWVVAAVLLVARIATGVYESQNPVREPDQVGWIDGREAVAVSQSTGRPILYDFSAEWDAPSQKMRDEVFADERLARGVSSMVVPVKVVDRRREDGQNSAWVDSLQRAHQVTTFPTLVVVDSKGRAVDRLEGFPGPQPLVQWLSTASARGRLANTGSNSKSLRLTFP